jgi:glycosyltransferase involved in cell wall biosynthesis
MPPAFLLDLTHTSHTRARTGVQRVARSVAAALGDRALPLTYDPYLQAWRPLAGWERANLSAVAPARKRGSRWPLHARLRGALGRFAGPKEDMLAGAELGDAGLLVPEIFSPAVAGALPALLARVRGPRVAIFHDAIALQLPGLTPPKSVARFPAYLAELLAFDGIAAVSEDSRRVLLDHWDRLGAAARPPVVALPLAIDAPAPAAAAPGAADSAPAIVLCVASLEGRKNQAALLDACERLWAAGARFELRLIGLAQRETGQAALEKIAALRRAGRPVRYDGPVDEATLAAAYRACAFTVYPSLMEGFGLPVLESLSYGRPCICAGHGALGEAARGGGCVVLEAVDTASLAAAVGGLLGDAARLAQLSAEARARRFKTWPDYVRELSAWAAALPRKT